MFCFFFIVIGALIVTGWWENHGEEIMERREIARMVKASLKSAQRPRRRNRWSTAGRSVKICNH